MPTPMEMPTPQIAERQMHTSTGTTPTCRWASWPQKCSQVLHISALNRNEQLYVEIRARKSTNLEVLGLCANIARRCCHLHINGHLYTYERERTEFRTKTSKHACITFHTPKEKKKKRSKFYKSCTISFAFQLGGMLSLMLIFWRI